MGPTLALLIATVLTGGLQTEGSALPEVVEVGSGCGVAQPSHQVGTLVGGDAAGDTEEDLLLRQTLHGAQFSRAGCWKKRAARPRRRMPGAHGALLICLDLA